MTDRTHESTTADVLNHSEADYSWLFEASGIGNAEIQLDTGRFIQANRRYCQLTGYSKAELLGMTYVDVVHPDDRAGNLEAIRSFVEGRTATFEIEKRYLRKDGAVVWVQLTGALIRDESGKAVRLLGSVQDIAERKAAEVSLRTRTGVNYDITERKQAEKRAMDQAPHLREQAQLLDLAPVLVLDMNCRIVTWNTGTEGMYGFAREEAEGRISHKLLATVFPQSIDEIMRALFEEGSWHGELTHTCKGGGQIVVASRWVLHRDDQGNPWRILEINADITERKRAEQALAQSETTLRAFYDNSPVLMGVTELLDDGDILHVHGNPATCQFFGAAPGTTIGKRALAELGASPQAMHIWRDAYLRSEATGQPVSLEHEYGEPQGIRWLSAQVGVVGRGPTGRTRFCYVAHDVTDERRAVDALQFQLDLTRSITDNATTAIFMTDDKNRCSFMNPAAEQMTGFTFKEIQGGVLHDFIHHHHPDGSSYPLSQCPLATAIPENDTLTGHKDLFFRKTGEPFPVLCNVRVTFKDGKAVGKVIEVRDTTNEEEAADALRRQTARSNRLLEANVIGVIFGDMERITEANDAFLEMVGYSRADLESGQLLWRVMTPPEFEPVDHEAVGELMRCGVCTPFQKEYYRKDGSRVSVMMGAALLDSAVPTWVCFVQDMSRVKEVEIKLREADRRKDEFLATLAHELRNPLAPIRNALQVLKAKGPQDPDLVWGRDVIDRQVVQMARLLDDLLDVSRITRNKLELRRSRVSLAMVMDTALETSRPLIDQMGHQLVVRLPPQRVTLDGDTTRLAQVFSNLLNNAAKYSDPGSRISLTSELQESEIVVSVRDTGIGIARDHLRHIFEMFSQEVPALERAQGGLGIGLSLVRGLVELHGGSVEARSEGPGQGSEFVVRLPVVGELAQSTPTEREGETIPVKTSLRILVVDDNRDGADSLSIMLKLMGNDTRTAYNGAAAVVAADEFRPDVILLDIGLPEMSGYDVCRHIQREPWGKQTFIIAQTGWGQAEDLQKAEAAGFDYHFVKPVDTAALTKLLAGLQPVNR